MQKYATKLTAEMTTLTGRAKDALAQGKREQAVSLLKLKKLRTDEVDKIGAKISNLERLVMAIESEAANQAFLKALAEGNSTLKSMQEVSLLHYSAGVSGLY